MAKSSQRPGKELQQEQAILEAKRIIPEEAGLYKVGIKGRSLVLHFGIPGRAKEEYSYQIAEVENRTGWPVHLEQNPHGNAMEAEVRQFLPESWQVIKPFSVRGGQAKQVVVSVNQEAPDIRIIEQAARNFERWTGFQLVIQGTIEKSVLPKELPAAALISDPAQSAQNASPNQSPRLRLNEALARIKAWFTTTRHKLMKIACMGDRIEVGFITPNVAELYRQDLLELERVTGYTILVRSHHHHNEVRSVVLTLIPEAWGLNKKFRVNVLNGTVCVAVTAQPLRSEIDEVCRRFKEETGYTLTITSQL